MTDVTVENLNNKTKLEFQNLESRGVLNDFINLVKEKNQTAPIKLIQLIETALYSASSKNEPIDMSTFSTELENQIKDFLKVYEIDNSNIDIPGIIQKINFILDENGITPFANSSQEKPQSPNYRVLAQHVAKTLGINLRVDEVISVESQDSLKNILSYRQSVDNFFKSQIENKGGKLQFFTKIKETLNTDNGPFLLKFDSSEIKQENESEAMAFILKYLDTSRFNAASRYVDGKLEIAILSNSNTNVPEGFNKFEVFEKIFGESAQQSLAEFNQIYETPERKWANGILEKAKQRFETAGKVGLAAAKIAGSFAVNYIPAISFITSAKGEMSKFGEYDSALSLTDSSFTWGSYTLKTWDQSSGMKTFKNIDLMGKDQKISPQVYLLRQAAIRESKLTTDPRIEDFANGLFEFQDKRGFDVKSNFLNGISKLLTDKSIYDSFLDNAGIRNSAPSYNDLFTQFEIDKDDSSIGLNSRNIFNLIQILSESASRSEKGDAVSNFFGNIFLIALQNVSLKENVDFIKLDSNMVKKRNVITKLSDRIRGMNVSRTVEAAIAGGRTAGMTSGMLGNSTGFAIDAMLAVPSTVQTIQRRVEKRVLQKIEGSQKLLNNEIDEIIKDSILEVSIGFAAYAVVSVPLRALGVKLNSENGGSWLEQKLSTNVVDYLGRVFAALLVVKRKIDKDEAKSKIDQIFQEETGRSGTLLGTMNTFNRIMKEFPDVYASFMLAINGASMGSGLNTLAGSLNKGEDIIHKVANGYGSISNENINLPTSNTNDSMIRYDSSDITNETKPVIDQTKTNELNSFAADIISLLENAATKTKTTNIENQNSINFEDLLSQNKGRVFNLDGMSYKVNNLGQLEAISGGFSFQVDPARTFTPIELNQIAEKLTGKTGIQIEPLSVEAPIFSQDEIKRGGGDLPSEIDSSIDSKIQTYNSRLQYRDGDKHLFEQEFGSEASPLIQNGEPGATNPEQFLKTTEKVDISILGDKLDTEKMTRINWTQSDLSQKSYYIRDLKDGLFRDANGQAYITGFDEKGNPSVVFKLDNQGNPIDAAQVENPIGGLFTSGKKELDFDNDGKADLELIYKSNGRVDQRFVNVLSQAEQTGGVDNSGNSSDVPQNPPAQETSNTAFVVSDTNKVNGILGYEDGKFTVERDWTGAIRVKNDNSIIEFNNNQNSVIGLDAFNKNDGTKYDFVQVESDGLVYTFNKTGDNVRLQSIHLNESEGGNIKPLWGRVPTEINDNIRTSSELGDYARTLTPEKTITEEIKYGRADQRNLKPTGDVIIPRNGLMGGTRQGTSIMPIKIDENSQIYILQNPDKRWININGEKFMSAYNENGNLIGLTNGYEFFSAQSSALSDPNATMNTVVDGRNLQVKYNGGYIATIKDVTDSQDIKTLWSNPNRSIAYGNDIPLEQTNSTITQESLLPKIAEGVRTVQVDGDNLYIRNADFSFSTTDGVQSRYVEVTDLTGNEINGILLNKGGSYSKIDLTFTIPKLADFTSENSVLTRTGSDGNIYLFVEERGAVRIDAIVRVNSDNGTWTPVFRRAGSLRELSDEEIKRLVVQPEVEVDASGGSETDSIGPGEPAPTPIPEQIQNYNYPVGIDEGNKFQVRFVNDRNTTELGSAWESSRFGGDIGAKNIIKNSINHRGKPWSAEFTEFIDSKLKVYKQPVVEISSNRGSSFTTLFETDTNGNYTGKMILAANEGHYAYAVSNLQEEGVQAFIYHKLMQNSEALGFMNKGDLVDSSINGNVRATAEVMQAALLGSNYDPASDELYTFGVIKTESDGTFSFYPETASDSAQTIYNYGVETISKVTGVEMNSGDFTNLLLSGQTNINGIDYTLSEVNNIFNQKTNHNIIEVFGMTVNSRSQTSFMRIDTANLDHVVLSTPAAATQEPIAESSTPTPTTIPESTFTTTALPENEPISAQLSPEVIRNLNQGYITIHPDITNATMSFEYDNNQLIVYLVDSNNEYVSKDNYEFKHLQGDEFIGVYNGRLFIVNLNTATAAATSVEEFNANTKYPKTVAIGMNDLDLHDKQTALPTLQNTATHETTPTAIPRTDTSITPTVSGNLSENVKVMLRSSIETNILLNDEALTLKFSSYENRDKVYLDIKQLSNDLSIPDSDYDYEYIQDNIFIIAYKGKIIEVDLATRGHTSFNTTDEFNNTTQYSKMVVIEGNEIKLVDRVSATLTPTPTQNFENANTPEFTPTPTESFALNYSNLSSWIDSIDDNNPIKVSTFDYGFIVSKNGANEFIVKDLAGQEYTNVYKVGNYLFVSDGTSIRPQYRIDTQADINNAIVALNEQLTSNDTLSTSSLDENINSQSAKTVDQLRQEYANADFEVTADDRFKVYGQKLGDYTVDSIQFGADDNVVKENVTEIKLIRNGETITAVKNLEQEGLFDLIDSQTNLVGHVSLNDELELKFEEDISTENLLPYLVLGGAALAGSYALDKGVPSLARYALVKRQWNKEKSKIKNMSPDELSVYGTELFAKLGKRKYLIRRISQTKFLDDLRKYKLKLNKSILTSYQKELLDKA